MTKHILVHTKIHNSLELYALNNSTQQNTKYNAVDYSKPQHRSEGSRSLWISVGSGGSTSAHTGRKGCFLSLFFPNLVIIVHIFYQTISTEV